MDVRERLEITKKMLERLLIPMGWIIHVTIEPGACKFKFCLPGAGLSFPTFDWIVMEKNIMTPQYETAWRLEAAARTQAINVVQAAMRKL